MKKTFALLIAVAGLGLGCSTTNIAELVKAMSQSDATVVSKINTIYGTSSFIRTNPRTNQTATISPDGTVTIGVKFSPAVPAPAPAPAPKSIASDGTL